MKYESYMREALELAAAARDEGDWAIGCVIVLDETVIARGRNRVNSSRDRLAHAEIDALKQLQAQHFEHTRNPDMLLVSTFEPCPMCFGAIVLNGIRNIVSGVNVDGSGASALAGSLPAFFQQARYETTLTTGVLARECAEMWASGDAAQAMLANGYELARPLEDIADNEIVTVTTKVNL